MLSFRYCWSRRLLPSLVAALAFLALALVVPVAAVAQDADADADSPFEIPVQERVFANGFKVLVVPNPASEVVSCRIFYRVGSAQEQPGLTGMAHYLEHMMFKGTEKVGVTNLEEDRRIRAELDATHAKIRRLQQIVGRTDEEQAQLDALHAKMEQLIEAQREVVHTRDMWEIYQSAGGTGMNASTSRDWTQYQITLPANRLELFMWVEADRMRNSTFREFFAEKKVVREERRLSENEPDADFHEAVQQMVYGSHPYAWPVLGWHEDVENITRADMQRFYDTWYQPDNAVMILVGNVDAEAAFGLAHRYFGTMPRGERPRRSIPYVQPYAAGERRMVGTTEGEPSARATYYRQAACGTDEAVYWIISGILSGPTGRLEKRLVREQELATSASVSTFPARYINTMDVAATCKGDHTPAAVLAAIDEELQRLCDEPVSEDELLRARNQLKSQLVNFLKNDEILGIIIGVFEVVDSWRGINRLIAATETVTVEDVQRVARETFRDENRCVALLNKKNGDEPAPQPPIATERVDGTGRPADVWTPESIDATIPDSHEDLEYAERTFTPPHPDDHRVELANGLRLYVKEDHRYPTVTVTAHIKAGSMWEPRPYTGLASAVGETMTSGGTADLDEDALKDRLAQLSATLTASFDRTRGTVTLTCFASDLAECLRHFRDVLTAPAFRADALDRWKRDAQQAIEHRNDTPGGIWMREFQQAVFGPMHPAARVSDERSVDAIGREQLAQFHRDFVRPQRTILAISGHFDREQMVGTIRDLLGEWSVEGEPAPVDPVTEAPQIDERRVLMLEKASSQGYTVVGHTGPQRPTDDWHALQLLNTVLRTRLFQAVRMEEGLAYSAGSFVSAPEEHPGVIAGYFQSKSETVLKALHLTQLELHRICTELIPADELARHRDGMIDAFPRNFGDAQATMDRFAGNELAGRPQDVFATWREKIAALTPEQLLEVAKRHIHPGRMTVVIVGEREAIEQGGQMNYMTLDAFGTVEHRHIDPPAETGESGEETPSDVVDRSMKCLSTGDIDGYAACFTEELQAELTPQVREQLRAQLQMLGGLEWEIKSEKIDGDSATVAVEMTITIGGQQQTQQRELPLVKEDGRWAIVRPR